MSFKKIFKSLNVLSLATVATVPMFFSVSCGNCKHEEGELVSLYNNDKQGAIYKCKKCHKEYEGPNPDASLINIPVMNINGDFSQVSKETKTKMSFTYKDPITNQTLDLDCTVKIQGNYSAILYPKKNYNVVFYEKDSQYQTKKKVLLNDNWTSESKYTLKANYRNGHLRNTVSGRIIASALKQDNIDDQIDKVVNCGCIDGFPIALYQNNIFYGLYILNVAKDKQMFKSKDETIKPRGILSSDLWKKSTKLTEPITKDFDTGIENEYCDTSDTTWMVNSFNALIDFNAKNDGDAFKSGIGNYLDVERTLDYIALAHALYLPDNMENNVVFATFDGTKWFPSLYDLDISLGVGFDTDPTPSYKSVLNSSYDEWNDAFKKFQTLFANEIKAKYVKFRNESLKTENVVKIITDFEQTIPAIVNSSDCKKWPDMPLQDYKSSQFMCEWITNRLNWLDSNL